MIIVPIVCHWWQICRRCCWYPWQYATGIVDTGGKFTASIIDTGGYLPPVLTTLAKMVEKFANGVVDTCANLPPVSTTPVAILPPVSLTLVANFSTIFGYHCWYRWQISTDVNDAQCIFRVVDTLERLHCFVSINIVVTPLCVLYISYTAKLHFHCTCTVACYTASNPVQLLLPVRSRESARKWQ